MITQDKRKVSTRQRFSIYTIFIVMYVSLIYRKINDLNDTKVIVGTIAILLLTYFTIADEIRDRKLDKGE